jgi:hypothetical protein
LLGTGGDETTTTTTTTVSDILTHSILILNTIISNVTTSPRNGNPEEPVYLLKAKQGYTVSKFKKVTRIDCIRGGEPAALRPHAAF